MGHDRCHATLLRNPLSCYYKQMEENTMLSWALTFLIVALVAGVLGFGGIAGASAGIAKILFFLFLVLFLVSLVLPNSRPTV